MFVVYSVFVIVVFEEVGCYFGMCVLNCCYGVLVGDGCGIGYGIGYGGVEVWFVGVFVWG